jgi:hypothetical protein
MYGRGSGLSKGFDCATIGRLCSASDIEAVLLLFVDGVINFGICSLDDDGGAPDPEELV